MAHIHEQRRPRALDRYLAGDPLEDICRAFACSQSWLSKWRDRDLATDPSWSAARSSRPRTTPTTTPPCIARVVVALRQTLAQQGKDWGAAAIQQALAQRGLESVPSQRTISRILHRYAKEVPSTYHQHPSVSWEMCSRD